VQLEVDVLREVDDDHGWQVDPHDPERIAALGRAMLWDHSQDPRAEKGLTGGGGLPPQLRGRVLPVDVDEPA
jgi:hypothetical protein